MDKNDTLSYFSSGEVDLDQSIKNEIKDKLEDAIKFIFKPYGAFLLTFDSQFR